MPPALLVPLKFVAAENNLFQRWENETSLESTAYSREYFNKRRWKFPEHSMFGN